MLIEREDVAALPPGFDPAEYRRHNGDLVRMADNELAYHYAAHGAAEGRRCSRVYDRGSFLALVPPAARILEIGPFWAPAFRRPAHDVAYVDALDTEQLRRKAAADPNSGGSEVPEIDYVWNGEPYRTLIGRTFDVVFSSHNIEHQPDLIGHFLDIADVLRPHGLLMLVIPDKRFCFDHFLPESDVAEVVQARVQRRTRHTVAKVLADQMMHAHNDPARHWRGDHGDDPRHAPTNSYRLDCIRRIFAYEAAAREGAGAYVDAHAWQFTPGSFAAIVDELEAAGLIPFRRLQVYPTVSGSFEFYAALARK